MKLKFALLGLAALIAAGASAVAQTKTTTPAATNVTAEVVATNAVRPVIDLRDTTLTDAISFLARMAGINFIMDPNVALGAPGPGGAGGGQPIISLRWENLTPEQALRVLLNNYNLVLIEDPKLPVARITKKEPNALPPLLSKVVQLKYAYATNIMVSAQAILSDSRCKVLPDVRTSQLIILATEKDMTNIDELISRLDMPTKQVLIEAKLLETLYNPTSSKGVDWTQTLGGQRVTFGNGSTAGTYTTTGNTSSTATYGATSGQSFGAGSGVIGNSSPPFVTGPVAGNGYGNTSGATTGTTSTGGLVSQLVSTVGAGGLSVNTAKGLFPNTAFLNADGVSAVLSFLNTETDSKVLSTPRGVTLDNEELNLSVTFALPIFQVTPSTANTPGSATITYTNVGNILKVRPRISANNTIALRVVPEVSQDIGPVTETANGATYSAEQFEIRRMETQVLIPSGNTLVMGGLSYETPRSATTKVPVLGDIPFLGAAFRSENKSLSKQNLIIFVTPTIVTDADFQPAKSTFLKEKPDDKPTPDFNSFDSGKAKDWSTFWGGDEKTSAYPKPMPATPPVFPTFSPSPMIAVPPATNAPPTNAPTVPAPVVMPPAKSDNKSTNDVKWPSYTPRPSAPQ